MKATLQQRFKEAYEKEDFLTYVQLDTADAKAMAIAAAKHYEKEIKAAEKELTKLLENDEADVFGNTPTADEVESKIDRLTVLQAKAIHIAAHYHRKEREISAPN